MTEDEFVKATRPGALFIPFIAVAVAVAVAVVVEDVELLSLPVVDDVAEEEEEEEEEVRMVYKISSNTEGRSNFSLSNTLMN